MKNELLKRPTQLNIFSEAYLETKAARVLRLQLISNLPPKLFWQKSTKNENAMTSYREAQNVFLPNLLFLSKPNPKSR